MSAILPPATARPGRHGALIVVAAVTATVLALTMVVWSQVAGRHLTLPPPPHPGEAAAGGPSNAGVLAGTAEPAVVYIVAGTPGDTVTMSASGLVLKASGLVVTNAHVIEGSTSIRVIDVHGTSTYGRVVGSDESDDIAVVQMAATSGIEAIVPGDPAGVRVGDGVVAVGNAVGKSGGRAGTPAYVSGRVTGVGKAILTADLIEQTTEVLRGLIETNAPVVSGDSGGALVDRSGKVIAMVTAGNAEFMLRRETARGYAIPIDRVLQIAGRLAGLPG